MVKKIIREVPGHLILEDFTLEWDMASFFSFLKRGCLDIAWAVDMY